MDQATFTYNQAFTEKEHFGVIDMFVILFIGLVTGATMAYGIVLLQQNDVPIVVPTTTVQGKDGKTIELPAGAKIDQA